MVEFDDFKLYLPQYLSADSLEDMFDDIKKFVQTGSSPEYVKKSIGIRVKF